MGTNSKIEWTDHTGKAQIPDDLMVREFPEALA